MADSTEKLPIPGESMSVLPIVEYPSEKEEAPSPVETAPLLPDLKEPEDFYNLGHHIRIDYSEVFVEPRHYEKTAVGKVLGPILKGIGSTAFENVQASLYYGLSIIIGIILSVIWAICFAVNSFVLVWLYQPMIKLNFAWLRMFSILYNAGVRVALDPVYKSCALVFSSIAGKFTFDMRGLQDKTAITTL